MGIAIQAKCQCFCKRDKPLNVCYFSEADLCKPPQSSFFCNSLLDYSLREKGIILKLKNPSNYGINGIVNSELVLKKLPYPSTVKDLEDCGCDILFSGSFPKDTIRGNYDPSTTGFSVNSLSSIKDWSVRCKNNVVILTQGETTFWGYEVQDIFSNKGLVVKDDGVNPIFEGPFGSVDSFEQIGSAFQGGFTKIPATGINVFGVDANGIPTIVLDSVTNDIMLADFAFLSNWGLGSLSESPDINNYHDVIAANIFAYAIQIAKGTVTNSEKHEVCSGTPIMLPGGSFTDEEGLYIDTLQTDLGCDSIIYSQVTLLRTDLKKEEYFGCTGDGYFVEINGARYDERNPVGTEVLQNSVGCDSLIEINLTFNPASFFEFSKSVCSGRNYSEEVNGTIYDETNPIGIEFMENRYGCDSIIKVSLDFLPVSTTEIQETICSGSGFEARVNNKIYNEANPTGVEFLVDQFGCDSIISINLEFTFLDTTFTNLEVCEGESINIAGEDLFEGDVGQLAFERSGKCDSIILFDIVSYPKNNLEIPESVTVGLNGIFEFENIIPEGFQVQWSPTINLSCSDCPNPILRKSDNLISECRLSILDKNECLTEKKIEIYYTQAPYIPSAFSPNSDGINDEFKIYFSQSQKKFLIKNFSVFDRSGGLVFQNNNIVPSSETKWWTGANAAQGVYVYFIEIEFDNGEVVEYKGDVTLLK